MPKFCMSRSLVSKAQTVPPSTFPARHEQSPASYSWRVAGLVRRPHSHTRHKREADGSSPSAVQSPPGSSAELFVAEHPNQPGQAETIAPASFAYGASATLLGA